VKLPRFDWISSYGLVARLSAVDLYKRGGSAGSIDARLDALGWGVKDGIKLAAPVVQIDHLKNGFDVDAGFSSTRSCRQVSGRARGRHDRKPCREGARGQRILRGHTVAAALHRGEKVQIEATWQMHPQTKGRRTMKVTIFPDAQPFRRTVLSTSMPAARPLTIPAPSRPGSM